MRPRTSDRKRLMLAVVAALLALLVGGDGNGMGSYPLRISVAEALQDDHADGASGATPIDVPGRAGGVIDFTGDRDVFRFEGERGTPIRLRTELHSLRDSILAVLAEDGQTVIAFNDDADDLASEVFFPPPRSGTFFAVVAGFSSSTGSYTLLLEESAATLEGAPRFEGAALTIFGELDGDELGASAVGDFDGDGVPDLALGASGAGAGGRITITSGPPAPLPGEDPAVALANALGGLQIDGTPGDRFFGLAAGDLTGDGFDDLLTRSGRQFRLFPGGPDFFHGEGPGALDVPVAPNAVVSPNFAIAELSGDGAADLVYTEFESGEDPGATAVVASLGPFIDAGDGIAASAGTARIQAPAGEAFDTAVAAGDLTGDGQADVVVDHVVPNPRGRPGRVTQVTLIPGPLLAGSQSLAEIDSAASIEMESLSPSSLAVGDADLDGAPDLLIGADDFVLIVPQRVLGEGRFPFAETFLSSRIDLRGRFFGQSGFPLVEVADVDGDTLPDVLVGLPFDTLESQWSAPGSLTIFTGALRPREVFGASPGVVPATAGTEVVLHGSHLHGADVTLVTPERQRIPLEAVAESLGALRLTLPDGLSPGSYRIRLTHDGDPVEFADVLQLTPATREVTLAPGWNAVSWPGGTSIIEALESFDGEVRQVLGWDSLGQAFTSFVPDIPLSANSLQQLEFGDALWLYTPDGGVWRQPLRPTERAIALRTGFNLVMWQGGDVSAAEALASLGPTLSAAFLWDPAATAFRTYRPSPADVPSDSYPLSFGSVLWLNVEEDVVWDQPPASVGLAPAPPLPASPAEVEDALVLILSEFGTGSGFVVSGTQILTSAHVVRGARTVQIRFADGTERAGYVTGIDTALDAAAIEVANMPASVRRLDWQTGPQPALMDEVFAWGFPGGRVFGEETAATVTRGIVSAVRTEEGFTNIQMDALIVGGHSGGPVVLSDGRAVGINDFVVRLPFGNLNFAIDITSHRDRIRVLFRGD